MLMPKRMKYRKQYRGRMRGYSQRGNTVNHHPWLTELLVRRAAASPGIRRRMADLLEERATPAQLVTLRGMVKLFTG